MSKVALYHKGGRTACSLEKHCLLVRPHMHNPRERHDPATHLALGHQAEQKVSSVQLSKPLVAKGESTEHEECLTTALYREGSTHTTITSDVEVCMGP